MPIDIAIAVVEQQGQYLIGQRPADVALGGLWEFPGGKVQANESPTNAAIRECLEETGLVVEVVSEYPQREQNYEHGAVRLHFYRCRVLDAALTPRWPFCWVSRAELTHYEFPRGNDELLTLLASEG